MTLLVVSYPDLAEQDLIWILGLRQAHNRLEYSVLAPHFTIIFPILTLDLDTLVSHLERKLSGQEQIEFALRSSIVVPDDSNDRYYVLLVPDEGFSKIVKLHDSLYTGPLTKLLRLDIPYIPHITLGYVSDPLYCKGAVDSLNSMSFEIKGKINSLDVISKEGSSVQTERRFRF